MRQRRRTAVLRGLLVSGLMVGVLLAIPTAAGASEAPTANNPNFGGDCDPVVQACSLMQPEGNSDTVWGTVTYSISGDSISFVITPNPADAKISEAQYCDSEEPYAVIAADLCAGFDRQFGDGGPKSEEIDLTYNDGDNTYTGSATYNADEPNWVIHVVVNGETTYVAGNEPEEPEEPKTCPDGTTHTDTNDNGEVDEGECNEPEEPEEPKTCPDGTTHTDTNDNGEVDEGECNEPEEPEEPKTCPDGAAMPTTDKNGDDLINAADCVSTTDNGPTTTETETETPAPTAPPAVLGTVQESARPTDVLGASITKAAPVVAGVQLARTGNSSGLLHASEVGGLLVAMGVAITRLSRRRITA